MANRQTNEQLDRAGRLVLLSATGSEAETEAAASSPFVLARTRAAVAEEKRRRDESGGWLPIFLVARRAVPAMALVAVLAAILTVWSAQLSAPSAPVQSDEEALFGTPAAGVEQTVLASRNGPSKDEVFNIIVDRNYGEGAK
ncbi:MAG: hypothetical protein DMF75_19625 [Acidobacteria bacterium]|nr:MAG: hypothetical protein DMF75_19625 [Acidobacteriota bacterium]